MPYQINVLRGISVKTNKRGLSNKSAGGDFGENKENVPHQLNVLGEVWVKKNKRALSNKRAWENFGENK